MSRGAALSLYALLGLIWSSTWMAIKIGLELGREAKAAIGAIAHLAVVGSAVAFVTLTVLLRGMSPQACSFIGRRPRGRAQPPAREGRGMSARRGGSTAPRSVAA